MLGAIYGATTAPDATLWDASEFIAAAHSLGIPHPPGTPLFVFAAHVWRSLLWSLPAAIATNLFSAACAAAAGGAMAWLLARATRRPLVAVASAVCAGSASTIWSNATEAEVYAASLLLAACMLVAADRAGSSRDGRWRALLAFAFGLAVPLHLSALVAAPAAIVLAARRQDGAIDWGGGAILCGAFCIAAAVGLASTLVALLAVALAVGVLLSIPRARSREALLAFSLTLVACSALAMLPIRAMHDPALNSGNPLTWTALWDLVGRRQYLVQGLLPRQAPLWLQLGNLFEYADWQFGLGLAPGPVPTALRVGVTLLFGGLGAYGCAEHRRTDRRSWMAMTTLALCASIGLVIYLNLHAGPTYGYGVIADSSVREARDRDYFFALAFWVWGAWAGMGAMTLAAKRIGHPRVARPAALPIALNWRVESRRSEPGASAARLFAEALLWSVPPRGVLVSGGDNDTFPLWYAQTVLGIRRDVTVVTQPLLGADWYRAQLMRRNSLLAAREVTTWRGEVPTLAAIVREATVRGRPVALSILADSTVQAQLGSPKLLRGMVRVGGPAGVDSAVTRAFVDRFAGRILALPTDGESVDPAPAYVARLLRCPLRAVGQPVWSGPSGSLDSLCKSR